MTLPLYPSMMLVRTHFLQESKVPTSNTEEGRWVRGVNEGKSDAVSLLYDISGVQEAKIPRFCHSPCPFPISSPDMTKVDDRFIDKAHSQPMEKKGSSKIRQNQEESNIPFIFPHLFIPGPQLILTPPDEVAELLVVGVVVVLDSEQH